MGRIVAKSLPEGLVVPGLHIHRSDSAGIWARPKSLSATTGAGSVGFISAGPSEVSVQSNAIVEMRVRASDESEAVRRARQRFVFPLTAALMITTGKPVHIEILRAAPEDQDGRVQDQGWSVWSDAGFLTDLGDMAAMGESRRSDLVAHLSKFHNDRTAASAAADLVQATRLQWTSGGRRAELEASALRHFLVIERVSTRVASMRDNSPSSEEMERKRRIVAALKRSLETVDVDKNEKSVMKAAKEFDGAARGRLARNISFACEKLALSEEVRKIALDAQKLRNQALAHPGGSRASVRLAERVEPIAEAAGEFLRAYNAWT